MRDNANCLGQGTLARGRRLWQHGPMRLSIVVPACNEERRIGPMLDAYLPFFAGRFGRDFELLVVINGTTDGTARVVEAYAPAYPQLRCLVEPGRIGKGGALMRGFAAARGDWIGFTDADGSTPPHAFLELVESIGDGGCLIASRWCAGARVSPRQPLARRVASRAFNVLTRVLFGLRLTDTQCGAKLMRRDVLLRVLPQLGITQWAFDVDLLFQLKRAGCRPREIPTEWHDVEGSKIQIVQTAFDMTLALTRLRLVYSPLRWVVDLYNRYVDPFLHPPGMEKDHLVRHSLLLLVGNQASGVGNVLFQMLMVRALEPAAYGELAAMLNLFLLVSIPLGALGGMAAHFCAALLKEDRRADARAVPLRAAGDLTWLALLLLGAGLAGAGALARFFNLSGTAPLVLTLLALVVSLYRPLFGGALTGAQAFFWATGEGVVWSLARVLFAGAFVLAGWGVAGALAGNVAAVVLSLGFGVLGARLVYGSGAGQAPARSALYGYSLRYVLASCAYAVLSYADIAVVKHYFSGEQAGAYAIAAMVGRIAFFLPVPVASAMFPKVVSGGLSTPEARRTLVKGLVIVALITLSAAVGCTLFPQLVMRILTGAWRPELAGLVRGVVWALSPLPLVMLLMNYELAQRRFRVTWPLAACAVLFVAGTAWRHGELREVVACLAAANGLALLLTWWTVRRGLTRGGQAGIGIGLSRTEGDRTDGVEQDG